MATCPECGVSSRVDPAAMVIEDCLVAKPIGSFSLAGAQMKVSAHAMLRLRCVRCGWSIVGHLASDHFVARPERP